MSGAEVGLVLGLVTGAITCFHTAYQIYEAAHNAKGLPESFQVTAEQIPLVLRTLKLVEQNVRANAVDKDAIKAAEPVLKRCKDNANTLEAIFEKAISSKDTPRLDRYTMAFEMQRKRSKVRKSMELVMADLELLSQHQVFQDANALKEIRAAVTELEQISEEEDSGRFVHKGKGNQVNNTGSGDLENHQVSGGSPSWYKGVGTINIDNRVIARLQPPIAVEQPWTLPRQANPQFTGYADILDRITDCLLCACPRQVVCVLSGMGGIGKSESVLQVLDRNDQALRKWFRAGVFWVDCGSEDSADADYARIGEACGWSANRIHVKDKLAGRNEPSLLILDNCDDLRTDYRQYIPNSRKVSVILTTRLTDANKYASSDQLFLELFGLKPESAVDLLLTVSRSRHTQRSDHAQEIVHTLDYHPLAINVAGSLIQSAVYSIEEYAHALRNIFTQKELLNKDSEEARYKKITTTFEVSAASLKKLIPTYPSADDSPTAALSLMNILAFMHNEDVSEDIFSRAFERGERIDSGHSGEYSWRLRDPRNEDIRHLSAWHVTQCRGIFPSLPPKDRLQLFRKARAHLQRLSLIYVDSNKKNISVHLLVHAWMRSRVADPSKTCIAVGSMLALSGPCITPHDWNSSATQLAKQCRANFDIQQDVGQSTTETLLAAETLEVRRIWYVYANCMRREFTTEATKISLRILEQSKKLNPDQSEHIALTSADELLAWTYLSGVHYPHSSKAVELLEIVKRKRQESKTSRLYVPAFSGLMNDFETLSSDIPVGPMQHQTHTQEWCGQASREGPTAKAHVTLLRVKDMTQILPENLQARSELTAVLSQVSQGYLDSNSKRWIRTFLHQRMQVFSELDGYLSRSRIDRQQMLGRAYMCNGEIAKAIRIFEGVVKRLDKAGLPLDDGFRAKCVDTLTQAFKDTDQTIKSIPLLRCLSQIKEVTLREGHPDRLASQMDLAEAYLTYGHFADAITYLEHIVEVADKTLHKHHPGRLEPLFLLGIAYSAIGQINRATRIREILEDVKRELQEIETDEDRRRYIEDVREESHESKTDEHRVTFKTVSERTDLLDLEIEMAVIRQRQKEKDEEERARVRQMEEERARLRQMEEELARLRQMEEELARLRQMEEERARVRQMEEERARVRQMEEELARLRQEKEKGFLGLLSRVLGF